jgi:hypothetical protein
MNLILPKLKLWLNFITCTFGHTQNLPKVYLKQTDGSRMILEPLDVLAFHGHTFLNKAIQVCTDSKYNHVGLYVGGGRILHAIGEGLIIQKLQEAWADSDKFIDVYRYHYVQGRPLTFLQRDKIIEVANKYYFEHERYAVEELLILAFITELRKNTDFLGRKTVDESFRVLSDAFKGNKEPVICSEIVYRCFDEAGVPVRILPEGLHSEFAHSDSPIIQDFIARKENLYNVDANFVTPHDLVMSPDLVFVGQLQKEFT